MKPVDTKSALAMMIDIETLGLTVDTFVTQVGVCVANLDTGQYVENPRNYWLSNQGQDSRTIDFDTVRWWFQQDPKVSAGVFNPPGEVQRLTPWALFLELEEVVNRFPGMTVWGSPAMFDLPILTSLFGGAKPWRYNDERDMMTLYKLVDPVGALRPPDNDLGHDAAADAKWQMDYLIALHQYMKDNGAVDGHEAT